MQMHILLNDLLVFFFTAVSLLVRTRCPKGCRSNVFVSATDAIGIEKNTELKKKKR